MNKRTLAVFITTVILLLPCISAASTESTSLSESPDTAAVQTETETVYNVGQKPTAPSATHLKAIPICLIFPPKHR